jgi:hypothetical protein
MQSLARRERNGRDPAQTGVGTDAHMQAPRPGSPHPIQQASPVGTQRHPPPGGEVEELRLPAGPGGDGGKEPRIENCWRPPCSGEGGQMRGGGDGRRDA